MLCDVCKKPLPAEGKRYVAGFSVSLLGANPARKKIEEIFGKNIFHICHICLLSSLGVKKINTDTGQSQDPV